MDNSYIGKMVELYNENSNTWQLGKLGNYNFSKDQKDATSYTTLMHHNGKSISNITLSNEFITHNE